MEEMRFPISESRFNSNISYMYTMLEAVTKLKDHNAPLTATMRRKFAGIVVFHLEFLPKHPSVFWIPAEGLCSGRGLRYGGR